MTLIDRYGNPLRAPQKQVLLEEQSAPTLTGVRSIWNEQVASGLTPARLARILKESGDPGGDFRDYLTLAEEMEEREPQYRMALAQRKLAIRNLSPVVEAASESKRDKDIATSVQRMLGTTAFRSTMMHLADGIAKGFAVAENLWRMDGSSWTLPRIVQRDQRHFQFDRITGRELRLRHDGVFEGVELRQAKYVVHIPTLLSGLPIRQGLARTACWIFMLKSFSLKDWMSFLEIYGMPFRIGKYGPNASKEDKRALLKAVANVAADGGCIIPESMLLEFIETKAGNAGENAFKGMAEYLDDQFAKLILGQTMTSDDGSSEAQANVHDDIRLLICAPTATTWRRPCSVTWSIRSSPSTTAPTSTRPRSPSRCPIRKISSCSWKRRRPSSTWAARSRPARCAKSSAGAIRSKAKKCSVA